jgi:hypothetical protein
VPDRSSAGSSSPPRWLPIRRPEIIVLLKQFQSGSFEPKGSDGGRRNNDDLVYIWRPFAKGQTKLAVPNDGGGLLVLVRGRSIQDAQLNGGISVQVRPGKFMARESWGEATGDGGDK